MPSHRLTNAKCKQGVHEAVNSGKSLNVYHNWASSNACQNQGVDRYKGTKKIYKQCVTMIKK